MTTTTPGHTPVAAPHHHVHATAAIPPWLLMNPDVSPGAKLLYAAVNMHLGDGYGWPTTEALTHMTGFAERTVRAQLKELVRAGAVHRERGVGYQTGLRYRLVETPEGGTR